MVEGDGPVHLITSKILGERRACVRSLVDLHLRLVEPPFDMGGYSSEDDDDEAFDNMSVTSDEEVAAGAGGSKD